MLNLVLILLLGVSSPSAFAEGSLNLCDYIDVPNCSGVSKQGRRSSSMSMPSPATSANFNPATVSFDKGLGVELMAQAGNPVIFNLATGTGKLGGILISPTLENSFFGNRVVEIPELFLERNREKHQYDNQKLSLALGGRLVSKKNFGLDLGLMLKRHNEIKKVNLGGGLSARIGPFTLGTSYYKDDFLLDFSGLLDAQTGLPYLPETYQESFSVQTYSIGTRYRNFFFDSGLIKTSYDLYSEEVNIFIYSLSYLRNNYLFNAALRNEHSGSPKFHKGELVESRKKNDIYLGLQYSLNRHLVFGVNYNYFLLRELSFKTSVFF